MAKRKQELEELEDGVQPHPAGDSSGAPKYALWDQPSKPLTHCDSLPSLFSPQQYNYTHCRPQEHSLCREGTAQYSVVSPAAHVIVRWKSTDTRRDGDVFLQHLFADVTCLCTLCCREAVRGRKGILVVNCMGQVRTWDIPRTS